MKNWASDLLLILMLGCMLPSTAQTIMEFPGQKLPGEEYRKLRFRLEVGDTLWQAYEKYRVTRENGESIYYLEVFRRDKLWKLFRYRIENGQTVIAGMQREFDYRGRIKAELECEDGQKICRDWRGYTWFPNDSLMKTGRFVDSKPVGEHYAFYDNGQLRSKILWEEGRLVDVLALYDQQGNSLAIGSIQNGNGIVNVYSMTGKLIEVQTFNKGKRKKRRKIRG